MMSTIFIQKKTHNFDSVRAILGHLRCYGGEMEWTTGKNKRGVASIEKDRKESCQKRARLKNKAS